MFVHCIVFFPPSLSPQEVALLARPTPRDAAHLPPPPPQKEPLTAVFIRSNTIEIDSSFVILEPLLKSPESTT